MGKSCQRLRNPNNHAHHRVCSPLDRLSAYRSSTSSSGQEILSSAAPSLRKKAIWGASGLQPKIVQTVRTEKLKKGGGMQVGLCLSLFWVLSIVGKGNSTLLRKSAVIAYSINLLVIFHQATYVHSAV